MEHIREYLLSVTAAAIFCGLLKSLAANQGSTGGILRLICGIFLTLTLIRPLADIHPEDLDFFSDQIHQDAHAAVEAGEDYGKTAMARIIKEETEAYILDKALAFDTDITVEVTVSGDPPVPTGCFIQGKLSSYAQQQLKHILEQDLGIGEEAIQWIS